MHFLLEQLRHILLKLKIMKYIFVSTIYNIRVSLLASDTNSGVHKLGIRMHVKTLDKDMYTIYSNFTESATAVSILCINNTHINTIHATVSFVLFLSRIICK